MRRPIYFAAAAVATVALQTNAAPEFGGDPQAQKFHLDMGVLDLNSAVEEMVQDHRGAMECKP